jgi:hypothetical protein
MRTALPLMLLLSLPALGQPEREQDPRAIAARAVKAHGGAAGIDRLRVAKVTYTMQGDLAFLGMPGGMDLTVEETYQLPRRIKKVIKGKVAGMGEMRVAWAIDGHRSWYKEGAGNVQTRELMGDIESNYRPFQIIEQLANDGLFQWSPAAAAGDDGSIAVLGTLKTTGGEVTFFFDKKTGLLTRVAARQMLRQPPKEVEIVTDYADYRAIGGVLLPMQQTILHDGKRSAQLLVADVQFYDSFEDHEFAPPGSGFLYVCVASVLAVASFFLLGRLIGARRGANGRQAPHAAGVAAIVGAIAGGLLALVIVATVQSLGLNTDPAAPGIVGVLVGLASTWSCIAGTWLAKRAHARALAAAK